MSQKERAAPAVAEITPEVIEQWKKQHGEVYSVEVGGKKGYVRKPNRNDLKYALSRKSEGELAMAEALFEDIWLGGDREILEVDEYFFGAAAQIQELLQIQQAILAKC